MAYDYMAERNALFGRSPRSALDSVAAPEDAAPEAGMSAARAAIARRQALQRDQQAYYDQMAKQLEQRRVGPSTSEQLFELSAALARPTTVRGFSGVLNNVMPVLQQQAKATREGAEGRTEALNALQMAQRKAALGLADTEVDTELQLAELAAKANKVPRRRTGFNPLTGRLEDMDTGEAIAPSAAAPPPPPAVGEVRDGYQYLGGDPANPSSYRKVK